VSARSLLAVTSVKVQMLTPEELRVSRPGLEGLPNTQFTCFTSTTVQILTPEELRASRAGLEGAA
jgi:hypothetical protein